MLRTRLWMGAVLVGPERRRAGPRPAYFEPWYPFLLRPASLPVAGRDLRVAAPARRRRGGRRAGWLTAAWSALLVANWLPHLAGLPPAAGRSVAADRGNLRGDRAVCLPTRDGRSSGSRVTSVTRIALTLFIAAYLGLLPSFLAQLRWLTGRAGRGHSRGTLALALAIFVPKCCDIGAYFTGRLLGRHRMTPVLSPKKTWEGFAGGLAAAVGDGAWSIQRSARSSAAASWPGCRRSASA